MDDGDSLGRIDDLALAQRDFDRVRRHAVELIDLAIEQLGQSTVRRTVAEYVRAHQAFTTLDAAPWSLVRDILGIDDPELLSQESLWSAYRSGQTSAEADTTIARLREFRAELTAAEESPRGRAVVATAFKIGFAVVVAAAVAAPLSAFLVGEPIVKEVVKAVVTTIVTVTAAEAIDRALPLWQSSPAARMDVNRLDSELQTGIRVYRAELTRLAGIDSYQECAARLELLAVVARAQEAHLASPDPAQWDYIGLLNRVTDATIAGDFAELDRCSMDLASLSSPLRPPEVSDEPGTIEPVAAPPSPANRPPSTLDEPIALEEPTPPQPPPVRPPAELDDLDGPAFHWGL